MVAAPLGAHLMNGLLIRSTANEKDSSVIVSNELNTSQSTTREVASVYSMLKSIRRYFSRMTPFHFLRTPNIRTVT